MSYNIDRWQQTQCSLFIPKGAIRGRLEDEFERSLDDSVTIELPAEDSRITGVWNIVTRGVDVATIEFWGAGSGNGLPTLTKLLESTKGKYNAWMVWEGGDSFSEISVDEGKVAVTDIDLSALFAEYAAMKELIGQIRAINYPPVFDPITGSQWRKAFKSFDERLKAIKNDQT